MNAQPYDGPERRKAMAEIEGRVRMLEELERAGAKSRKQMHEQVGDLKATMKEEFKDVAEAINNLGMELQSSKGTCPVDDIPCPKADVPWLKQWLTWIGAGEVAIVAAGITWVIQHAGK